MSEREKALEESTSAKATVDEKVEWARVALAINSPNVEEAVREALTALEERIEELEKERELGEAISKIIAGMHDLPPEDEKALHEYYERKYNKEARDAGE